MDTPIPQDWDGESWRCVQLQWPDSQDWGGLLNGLLTLLSRGRFWNADSGSIKDAQAVGWQIFNRNFPYTDCDGQPAPPIPPETIIKYQACSLDLESEDYEMPCLDLSSLIKIEDGQLWVKDSCCEWIAIGSLAGLTEDLGDDPLNPTNDPEMIYSACGKAYAAAELLFGIGNNVWDEIDNFPWQWVSHVESGVGLDLDNKWIIAGCNQAIIMEGLGYTRATIFTADDQAWLRCYIESILAADAAGTTEDQFTQIRHAMESHQGIDVFKSNLWTYIFMMLGWKDLRDITALGAADVSENCGCPDPYDMDPTRDWDDGQTWIHYWNLKLDDYEWLPVGALTVYAPGQGFVDWADQSTRYAKTAIRIPLLSENGTLKRMWIKTHIGTGFDYSGDLFRIKTDAGNIDQFLLGGDPISVGGDLIYDRVMTRNWQSTDNVVEIVIEGHIASPCDGPTDPDSPRIIAIAISGYGVDPFV